MNDDLAFISRWFAARCDGRWEHQFGISIETIDNPGWTIVIDLRATPLERSSFAPINSNVRDSDWIKCEVVDGKFTGAGDPSKFGAILRLFVDFAKSNT